MGWRRSAIILCPPGILLLSTVRQLYAGNAPATFTCLPPAFTVA